MIEMLVAGSGAGCAVAVAAADQLKAVWLDVDAATLPWLAANLKHWPCWEAQQASDLEADAAVSAIGPWRRYHTIEEDRP